MDKTLKEELDRAFDEIDEKGRIKLPAELLDRVRADSEAHRYLERLRTIDSALWAPPEEPGPAAGFVDMVLNSLPSRKPKLQRVLRLRSILLPLYILIVVAAAFVFSDTLGVTELFGIARQAAQAVAEISPEVAFTVVTSIGILISTWLIVTSFFGIRSRRVTR